MTDAIHEQLSAFIDGELSAAESELLLKRVERDPELAARLKRHMLAGEALRSPQAQGPSREFASRVAAAIDNESLPARARSIASYWLKPVAGGAIAAGVAALVLVSLRPEGGAEPGAQITAQAPMESDATTVAAVPAEPNDGSDRFVVPAADDANRAPVRVINQGQLANYVVAHSEYSSPLGRGNVLSGLLTEETGAEEVTIELHPDGSVTVRPRVPDAKAPNR